MARKRESDGYLSRYRPKSDAGERRRSASLAQCERLWTTLEVAAFLGVPVTTLHQWRTLGKGPDAFRVGRHLRYDPAVVRRWLVEECVQDLGA